MGGNVKTELTDGRAFTAWDESKWNLAAMLASHLHEHGLTKREAQAWAVDTLENEPFGERKALDYLATRLGVEQGTIRSHYSNADSAVESAELLTYITRGTEPLRVIGRATFPCQVEDTSEVALTVCRVESLDLLSNSGTSKMVDSDEEYVLFISEFADKDSAPLSYRGESVRTVTGRTRVVDELNRLLKEYRSNANPVRMCGEMLYALGVSDGPLDTKNEYQLRMQLVNPLCEALSPPDEYTKPPHVFGNSPSLVNRFE
jgi:hypothetical protein